MASCIALFGSKIILLLSLGLPLSIYAVDLKVGDLIFRKDPSYLSHLFSLAGGFEHNRFSHVGIVAKISPIEVWHVYDRGENALQKDSLESYLEGSSDHAVFRYPDMSLSSLSKAFNRYRYATIKFDYQFARDNNSLYCSEFVYNLLLEATNSLPRDLSIINLNDLVGNAKEVTSSER